MRIHGIKKTYYKNINAIKFVSISRNSGFPPGLLFVALSIKRTSYRYPVPPLKSY